MKQLKQRQNENTQIVVDDETYEKAVLVAQATSRTKGDSSRKFVGTRSNSSIAIHMEMKVVQEAIHFWHFILIHLHGLTSTQHYPYVGVEQSCRWNLVQQRAHCDSHVVGYTDSQS
jgi:hypothetical protein